MEDLYKTIADKLNVEEDCVRTGVMEAVNNDMRDVVYREDNPKLDAFIKEIIGMFYCESIETKLNGKA